jgi:hypothetical protein
MPKQTKPRPINPQPAWAVIECNDAIGPAHLVLSDLGGNRLLMNAERDGKRLSTVAITRFEARKLIVWLASMI